MSSFDKTTSRQPHLEISKPATEPQAVISRGEEFLDRAHRVAHEIEEHVHRLLSDSTKTIPYPSPTGSNQTAGNSHADDELARNEVLLDNRGRDG